MDYSGDAGWDLTRDDNSAGDEGDLNWPPYDAGGMKAWQNAVGDDAAIAIHLGLSRATVYNHRRRHGVAALPRREDRRVREKRPRARLSKRAIARLYAGRCYEDRNLRDRPVDCVRGAGWVF